MQISASYVNYFELANFISNLGLIKIPIIEPIELCTKAGEYTSAYEILDPLLASSDENISKVKKVNNEIKSYFPLSTSRNRSLGK
jgi:hypothetical protein